MDVTEPDREEEVAATVARVWQRLRPVATARFDLIASALDDCALGALSEQRRAEALGEAHKLAGVLGTYGFADGTLEVRKAEGLLREAEGSWPSTQSVVEAGSLASRLRAFVSTRCSLPEGEVP